MSSSSARHRATRPSRGVSRRALITGGAVAAGLAAGGVAVARMGSGSPTVAAPSTAPATGTAAPTPSPSATPSAAPSATRSASATASLAGWTLEEKVGQLLMVGTEASAASAAARSAITAHHVGNVFLSGRSSAGTAATASVVSQLTGLVSASTTHSTRLLVSTDQEGGNVQVLSGSGFSTIPSAVRQASMSAAALEASAKAWGRELAAAGLNMDLAPVADLVDIASPASNAPIGAWKREYGNDAATVAAHAEAFSKGIRAAGVIPTIKHFPGLGRVTGNTDTTAHVVDSTTTAGDAATGVFQTLIKAGAPVVMVASATYSRIDASAPAVFSSKVVTGLLRGTMGFTGVVITDDVAAAKQVTAWSAGDRAVKAVEAGVDIVLAAADASVVPAMVQALIARAQADAAFAKRVDESAARVLALKATLG